MTQDTPDFDTDSDSDSGTESDAVFAELNELVLARQNESINATQLARLEELVISNPQARRMYVRYMVESTVLHQLLSPNAGSEKETRDLEALQESLLAQRFGVEGDDRQDVIGTVGPVNSTASVTLTGVGIGAASAEGGRHRNRTGRKIAAAALIGLSLMGVLIYSLMPGEPAPPPQPVATLTESHHATWEDKDGRLIFIRDGKALPPQTLYLADGLAKLTFNDGAAVLLDAREHLTKFEVKASGEAFLHVGKITARAESEQSKGFTVEVPGNIRVIDVSTEFGIVVDEAGLSEVHVLDGEIQAHHADDSGKVVTRSVMYTGEAVAITPATATSTESVFTSIPDSTQRFIPLAPKPIAAAPEKPSDAKHFLLRQVHESGSRQLETFVVANMIETSSDAIRLNRLGAFDVGNDGFVAGSIRVWLWTEAGEVIASARVPSDAPLIQGYRYIKIADTVLKPNTRYILGALVGRGHEPFLDGFQTKAPQMPFAAIGMFKLVQNRFVHVLDDSVADEALFPVKDGTGHLGRWAPANAAYFEDDE